MLDKEGSNYFQFLQKGRERTNDRGLRGTH